jgi:sterol desaturase/sphingolipid hydroxylase (fatty acid hydroxylase superfamily)
MLRILLRLCLEHMSMEFVANIKPIGMILVVMALIALVETAIPLRQRTEWSRRHLLPNLAITLLTFATNLILNVPLLLGLVWLQGQGYGLLNQGRFGPGAEVLASVVLLDLAWYATHVSMHRLPQLWRFHMIHHSDPFVDVTTTARQHPGESLYRYLLLAVFGFGFGVSPAGFAAYKVAQILSGMFEHSNIRLPDWLEATLALIIPGPAMHKVHHSRDQRLTNSNYGNILSIWDRLFGTFTPPGQGRKVDYGLSGEDRDERQSGLGLMRRPFISE